MWVVRALLIEMLQDARRYNASAAQQHEAAVLPQVLVHMVVVLVGIHNRLEVTGLFSVALEIWQEGDSVVPYGQMKVAGDQQRVPSLVARAARGVGDGVPSVVGLAYRPHPAVAVHLVPANSFGLAIDRLEHVAEPWRIGVSQRRLA